MDSTQNEREQTLLGDDDDDDNGNRNNAEPDELRNRRGGSWVDMVSHSWRNRGRTPRADDNGNHHDTPPLGMMRSLCPPGSNNNNRIFTDILAGCTVGLMLVPQSMSYARLAGLPVQYGLYAATTAAYAYAAMAPSSSRLAVGPVAMVSLLLRSGLDSIVNGDSDNSDLYAQLAIQTAAGVGFVYMVLGWARAGAVVQWLSHAVVSGFTTAAAVIIMLSQTKYMVGYSVAPSDRLLPNLWNLWRGRKGFHAGTFLMGLSGTLFLLLIKHVPLFNNNKLRWIKAAGPLMITVTALVLTFVFQLQNRGIAVVGEIPSGLPSFTAMQWWTTSHLVDLVPTILGIVVVGFMESIAIAKQLATKLGYELDSSRELVSLGCANLAAGMFQGYPVAGSFSRSAINSDASSSLSGVVTATLVGSAVLLLTSVFEMLPLNVLAAIVISGVLGILDFKEAARLWTTDLKDFCCWMVAFMGTLFLGVEMGLGLAIAVSLLVVVWDMTRPRVVVLGKLRGTTHYVDCKQYADEIETECDSVLAVRIEAPLFFANADTAWDLVKQLASTETTNQQLRFIVIDMSSIPFVDGAAVESFRVAFASFDNESIQVVLACMSQSTTLKFTSIWLDNADDRDILFKTVDDAVFRCMQKLDDEQSCPEEDLRTSPDSHYGAMSRRTRSDLC